MFIQRALLPLALTSLATLFLAPSAAQAQEQATEQAQTERDPWERLDAAENAVRAFPQEAAAWLEEARALWSLVGDRRGVSADPYLMASEALGAIDQALFHDPTVSAAADLGLDVALYLGQPERASAFGSRLIGEAVLGPHGVSAGLLQRTLRARSQAFWKDRPTDAAEYVRVLSELATSIERARELSPWSTALVLLDVDLLVGEGLAREATELLKDEILARLAGDDQYTAMSQDRVSPSVGLHRRLIDLAVAAGESRSLMPFYAQLVAEPVNSGLVWYYRSYLSLLDAEQALRERDNKRAEQAFERTKEWLSVAYWLKPGYREGIRRLVFRADSGIAWAALGAGWLGASATIFLDALEREPDLRSEKDGLGRTLLDGIGSVVGRHQDASDFTSASDLARRVCEIHKDEGLWWNNLGFLLREKASQVESGQITLATDEDAGAAAKEIFRESWQSYLRASEIAPEDARIVNDAALIQVYHLRDELEKAEGMLNEAIATGVQRLADMGDEPREEERFPVAQAVGDAYQNLGYLYYHVFEKLPEARAFFVASIATDSGERGGMQQYVRAIDGEIDPIVERDAGAFVAAEEEVERVPGQMAWEHSFERALARARIEQRPVLVYYRGAGLGLAIPFYDDFVTTRAFQEATADFIPVVASRVRTTFVDRDSAGRRVPSAMFAGVTSTEHMLAAREFDAWWAARHSGARPGESEESIYLLGPDGERLELPEDTGRIILRSSPEGAAARAELLSNLPEQGSRPQLEQLRSRLFGTEESARMAAAIELSALPHKEAFDLCESLLFDVSTPTAVRRELIIALTTVGDELLDAMLADALGVRTDPVLQKLVAQSWPAHMERGPLQHIATWGGSAALRAAAAATLGSIDAQEALMRQLLARVILGASEDSAGTTAALAVWGSAAAPALATCASILEEKARWANSGTYPYGLGRVRSSGRGERRR